MNINDVANYLTESKMFFLATIEGNVPKVRPFGAAVVIKDKLYFATNNTKEVYKQMIANPVVEVAAAFGADWLRIHGTVKRDDSREARELFLIAHPLSMYSADDGIFEVFYFESLDITMYKFARQPEKITIQ
jgi:uncharacterized pyridoxamine 5'-phosphate oxidase family protein